MRLVRSPLLRRVGLLLALGLLCPSIGATQSAPAAEPAQVWVTSWAGSVQGPYPVGNASAQPDLSAVFPAADAGARDQSFRLIVRPDLWGGEMRLRLSNAFGSRPVTFDGVFVGLQMSGASVVKGTNRAVTFGARASVTIAPGQSAWSDPVSLPFWRPAPDTRLDGRKLAVSFHVAGESGPMTWHAKALTTSYVSMPGAGSTGADEREDAFPASTTSWYFLDAVDVRAPRGTRVIVALGDSITDGTASTLNGDDRWPDVLSRRLHAAYGDAVSVANAGIGGNRVIGPAEYSPREPVAGGPSAIARLDRDVLSLSGVSAVIWLEGINDFTRGETVDAVQAGMREVVARLHAAQVTVFGATLTSAVGNATGTDSGAERDRRRRALNEFIRGGGVFDGVFDFDRATLDPSTGAMRAEFVPDTTTGGPGDHLHPNRLGYAAMGQAIDLQKLMAGPRQAASARGRVVVETLHARSLEGNGIGDSPDRPITVYLPPSYDRDPSRRFPVVYLLHGATSDPKEWLDGTYQGLRLDVALDQQGAEYIVVMPFADNRLGGSFYVNSAAFGRWEDVVASELVRFIDGRFRTVADRRSRILAGHSMGGFGALYVAGRHPDTFAHVYAMSPCCLGLVGDIGPAGTRWQTASRGWLRAMAAAFAPDATPGEMPPVPFATGADGGLVTVDAVVRRWREFLPIDQLQAHPDGYRRLCTIGLEAGREDEIANVPLGASAFSQELRRAGITHTLDLFTGGHVNQTRARFEIAALPFFARVFANPASTGACAP